MRTPTPLTRPTLAALDPLARRVQHLMEPVADSGTSVLLSSHLVSDLERVCDYLVVLVGSRVQVTGEVEELLAAHHRLVCTRREPSALPAGLKVIEAEHTDRQNTFVVRCDGPLPAGDWSAEPLSLEDLVLTYLARGSAPAAFPATRIREDAR